MKEFMNQSISGEAEISPEIIEKIKTEGCPECGLKGGTHTPECYYFGAISPEMAAVKQPLVSDLSGETLAKAEAPKIEGEEKPAAKEPEKEMTAEAEGEFRKKLLEKAKAHEKFVKAAEPAVEGAAAPTPAVEFPEPKELKKEGVFEELFAGAAKTETPVVEKPKETILPVVEIKSLKEEAPSKLVDPEVKEVKKELKKEEIAANAVVAAVGIARDFVSAGSTKITEEQAEKAATAALKDWERITTGMTVDERFKTFSAAEQAILNKIPEGKILEKLKEKIYIVMEEKK